MLRVKSTLNLIVTVCANLAAETCSVAKLFCVLPCRGAPVQSKFHQPWASGSWVSQTSLAFAGKEDSNMTHGRDRSCFYYSGKTIKPEVSEFARVTAADCAFADQLILVI